MADDAPYKVLLAIDGSADADRAAEYVARYGHQLGVTEVYVLNVQPYGSYRTYALFRNEILLEADKHGEHAMAFACKALDEAKLLYRFHTELGEPADAIVHAAAAQQVEEIVMGTRGMGALGNLALGSVAYKVIRLAKVPVTVVSNPHGEGHLAAGETPAAQRVLLAVDGSEHAAHAVAYVCGLHAARVPITALLVNVQLPIVSGNFRRFVTREMLDAHYREEGEAALRGAKEALQNAGIEFESHIMAGHLAETIVQLAEQHRCARIVMGTHGLGTVANLVLGSVAVRVVHTSPIPVTLVK
jgi:nucleotide-binding universal stress UspA family protein